MGSVTEFRHWLHTYVQKLVQDTNILKLEALCEELFGPPSRLSNVPPKPTDSWNPTILGLNKRQLLRELLPLMSSNLDLQRLITKFREALVIITQREVEAAKSLSHSSQPQNASLTVQTTQQQLKDEHNTQLSQVPKTNQSPNSNEIQNQGQNTQDKTITSGQHPPKSDDLNKEINCIANANNDKIPINENHDTS